MAQQAAQNPFVAFLEQYGQDWVALVREVLGFEPDEKQAAILADVCRGERRVSVRSGHRVGKTTTLALINVCQMLTRFPQKTVCTAATAPQLYDALAAETKAWFKKLPPALLELFEIQVEHILLRSAPEESFIAFRTSKAETPEAMAGVHSFGFVLLIADEASGVPDPVFESAAGSMAAENAVMVLAGNPVRTSGLFFDSHHKLRDRWKTYHISSEGHPRVTSEFIDDMKQQYGGDSNAYRVRVLGEFPTGDEDTVIPFELMEAALHRDVRPLHVLPIWGVDCARFGSDSSALARRVGNSLERKVEERKGWDTMRVAGWVKSEFDACEPSKRPSEILVDVIGIGAGVLDRLVELKLPARGINVAEAPTIFDEQYANLRTELWFKGRDWLAQKDCNLCGDESLGKELIGPRFKYQSNGKRIVESKDDMRKRGVKSPNLADAFLLTLASESVSAISGGRNATSWTQPLKRKIAGIV